jgi:hypothetical protein
VEKINEGWPNFRLPARLRPRPKIKLSRELRDYFLDMAEKIIESDYELFSNGYMDHDKEEFRLRCKNCILNQTENGLKEDFEPDVFENLLYYCDRDNELFT